MQRKSHAALCLLAVAILVACTRNGPPNSLFESAGYHVRDGKVYYLNAFPGKAFEIDVRPRRIPRLHQRPYPA